MGWASGSILLSEIVEIIEEHSDRSVGDRVEMYKRIIEAFEDADCDTINECLDQSSDFDEAYRQLYPNEDLDE